MSGPCDGSCDSGIREIMQYHAVLCFAIGQIKKNPEKLGDRQS